MLAWKRLSRSKIIWPLITLGILMLFNLFFTPNSGKLPGIQERQKLGLERDSEVSDLIEQERSPL